MGGLKLDHLDAVLARVRDEAIPGDLVECGTGRGGAAIFMRAYLEATSSPTARCGSPTASGRRRHGRRSDATARDGGVEDLRADLNQVRDGFERFGLLDERVRFLQGAFAATLPDAPVGRGRAAPDRRGLGAEAASGRSTQLYDRARGRAGSSSSTTALGSPLVATRSTPSGRRRAITSPLERVGWSGGAWRKIAARPSATIAPTATAAAAHPPHSRRRRPPTQSTSRSSSSSTTCAEKPRARCTRCPARTSRASTHLDYEVIVVENGSDDDQRLGEEFVSSFGPEFRYLDLGDDATPSPTAALEPGDQGRARARPSRS